MAPLGGPGPGAGGGEREPAGGAAAGKWPSGVAQPSPAAARGASSLLLPPPERRPLHLRREP